MSHDDLLRRAPNLLIVSSNGAGFDPVDVDACTRAGVLVVNQSGGNAHSVAEHALGMLLTLSKRIIEADRALRRERDVNRNALIGNEAQGRPSASSASAMSAAASPSSARACSA